MAVSQRRAALLTANHYPLLPRGEVLHRRRYRGRDRGWFEAALNIGRPKTFGELRAAISRAFVSSGDESVRSVGRELMGEASAIESHLAKDRELLTQLFKALDDQDAQRAEKLRDELVTRGVQGRKRFGQRGLRSACNP